MTRERYRIANELWANGLKAEILYNENPRMDKQMDYSVDNRIPFIIFIGENEVKDNKVKVKCLANGKELIFERESYITELNNLKLDQSLFVVEHKTKNK